MCAGGQVLCTLCPSQLWALLPLRETLLLLLQSDLPYQLDGDLKTIGTTTINKAIDTEKQRFGAHYRTVTEADGSRRLVAFNFEEQSKDGFVHFFEFDEGFNRVSKVQHKLPVSASACS